LRVIEEKSQAPSTKSQTSTKSQIPNKIASRFYKGGFAAINQKDFNNFPLSGLEFGFSVIEICLEFGACDLEFLLTFFPSYLLTF
jgi:hypothetical protein